MNISIRKRFFAVVLVVCMLLSAIPTWAQEEAVMIPNDNVSFTAKRIKGWIESNKKLPNLISTGTVELTMPQLLQVMAEFVVEANAQTLEWIPRRIVLEPEASIESMISGVIYKSEYVALAGYMLEVVDTEARLLAQYNTSLGLMSYNTAIYFFACILNAYRSNSELPEYMAVQPWGELTGTPLPTPYFYEPDENGDDDIFGTPTPEPTPEPMPTPTPNCPFLPNSRVINTVNSLSSNIAVNKKLPNYATIAATRVSMPQLLWMAAQQIVNFDMSVTPDIPCPSIDAPASSFESMTDGELQRAEYVELAKRIISIPDGGSLIGGYATTLGTIGFETLLYTFSRIVAYYKANATLPGIMPVQSWGTFTGTPLPLPEGAATPTPASQYPTVTMANLTSAAGRFVSSVRAKQKLPAYLTIGTERISIADFMRMAADAVAHITFGEIELITVSNPIRPSESFTSGTMTQAEYISLAEATVAFISNTGMAPDNITTTFGSLSYQAATFMFADILDQYKSNDALPASYTVQAWSDITGIALPVPISTAAPTPTPNYTYDTLTQSEVAMAAYRIALALNKNNKLPAYVSSGTKRVSMPQILRMMAELCIHANNGDKNALLEMIPVSVSNTTSGGTISGTLMKAEYLSLANDIVDYVSDNGEIPTALASTLGTLDYELLVRAFVRIVDTYRGSGALPNSFTIDG